MTDRESMLRAQAGNMSPDTMIAELRAAVAERDKRIADILDPNNVVRRHDGERRERIATAVLPGLLADYEPPNAAKRAVMYADYLITELDKVKP